MLAVKLVLDTLANTGLEGCVLILIPLATEGQVSGVTQTTLNFMRSLMSFGAAFPQSCSLTMPLSLQVEDLKPAGISDTPELLAASIELGPEDAAGSSSGENAPEVDTDDGNAQKPQADVSSGDGSEQEADADCDDGSSLSQCGVRNPLC